MKRNIIVIMALMMGLQATAQLKPEQGDKGFSFQLNGLANLGLQSFESSAIADLGLTSPLPDLRLNTVNALLPQDLLFARYYLEEDKVLRVAVGAGYLDRTQTTLIDVADYQIMELSTFSGSIGIGFEQHYTSLARRIDPYGGLQVNFGYLGAIEGRKEVRSSSTGTVTTSEQVFSLPGGWRAQLNFIGGVNFFVTDNLSIGGEFALGPYYTSMNGSWTIDQTIRTETGGQSTTNTDAFSGNIEQTELGFRMGGTTGFNVSFFF